MLSRVSMTAAPNTAPEEDECFVFESNKLAESVKNLPVTDLRESASQDGRAHQHDSSRPTESDTPFQLDSAFIESYSGKKPRFGLDGLGQIVFQRTYSRLKEDGSSEEWYETCARVVTGCYKMQQGWIVDMSLGWDPEKAQRSAQRMYRLMFELKFLPAGRGIWAMGSPLTDERNVMASLNSCAFVSTAEMWLKRNNNPAKPFTFLADVSMLGIGCGFDDKGACEISDTPTTFSSTVKAPKGQPKIYKIPDTREGWVESIGRLINSYLHPAHARPTKFNYSGIRLAGAPIKGFGGIASGPQPLIDLHKSIKTTLDRNVGSTLSVTSIVDIMNLIGKCIVSGNVRRTAEIAIGQPTQEFLDLKNYNVNSKRMEYGWVSNNSCFAELGGDYSEIAARMQLNGEPGVIWLDNHKKYGRMGDPPTQRDSRVAGVNPCAEQSLETYETCNLVEVFLPRIKTLEEFKETLKFAFIYAKTVTLGQTHIVETNRVLLRNRRIGTSLSGVAQFLELAGIHQLCDWLQEGYAFLKSFDCQISDFFAIPLSIKITSVKPSGTISLLAGATPGLHYAENRYCLRRVRISKMSKLIDPLRKAGYRMEECVNDSATMVVEFPIDYGPVRSLDQVSMHEQLCLASLMQRLWSDNSVSCTITFDPKTEGPHIESALKYYQYQLKAVSFLPRLEMGAFPQMPFEKITQERYEAMKANVDEDLLQRLIKKTSTGTDGQEELFCDTEKCMKL